MLTRLRLSRFAGLAAFAAAVGVTALADAAQVQTGNFISIYYGSNGVWVDGSTGRGLEITSGGTTKAVTWPGTPWSQITVEFDEGTTARTFQLNEGVSSSGVAVVEQNLSTGTTNKSRYQWTYGNAVIERIETWDDADKVVQVVFKVTNTSPTVAINNFRLMAAIDPDQDTTTTRNDVRDLNGNAKPDFVHSESIVSGWTVAYGACDEDRQSMGHTAGWDSDADAVFTDQNDGTGDWAMHWRHIQGTIPPSGTATFSYVLTFDTTKAGAASQFTAARATKCVVTTTGCVDLDGDGATSAACGGTDCNDGNAAIHPGAPEVCDGIDNNCAGGIDEGVMTTFYRDADGDSYGNPAATTLACSQPSGYVTNGTDCNDTNASIKPGAPEICNGVDDNCNATIDEGVKSTFYADSDGDGFGNLAAPTLACTAPAGYVADSTDCNDGNAAIKPGAPEVCNGVDDNCNASVDEGVRSTFYADTDGDGYGNPAAGVLACTAPAGYVTDNTDCNDAVATTHPGAAETCNGADDNCNGTIDDGGDALCTAGSICIATGTVTTCRAGCRTDAGCAAPKGLCDATKLTCEVCTATDATGCASATSGKACIVEPSTESFCGCTTDADCGDAKSGRICEPTTKKCMDGCAVAETSSTTPRNGCPDGKFCSTKTPGATGICTATCNFDSDCTGVSEKPYCITSSSPADAGTDASTDADDAASDASDDADAGSPDAGPTESFCGQCRNDVDCAGRTDGKTVCGSLHLCVECTATSKDECSASGSGSACLPEGRCGCTTSGDCAAGKECKTSTGTCEPIPDAGPGDSGPSDTGTDSAVSDAADSGAPVDPSSGEAEAGGSCGCELPGKSESSTNVGLVGLAALGAVLVRRRRR